jgi:tape measure domain-containing protein
VATIDDKVVAMSFENKQFEQGVNQTISSLDKLKASLHFPNAGKGFDEINAAAKRMDLGGIAKVLEDIKGRLNAFRLAAVAVFAQVAQKAVAAGTRFAKSFTLDPVKAGFAEYTTNLNAVQTILANTQASGAKLSDVNAALKQLNDYSDKTIYNFSQMAKNIGTFTAAGVDLDTSTNAIKGIANLAALSGSNADQASTAMYQLSQALSAGAVKLQDWNSVVNAGMGGTVFQRALAQTAVAMGTLDEKSLKLTGKMKNVSIAGESFRNSLSKPGKDSWLTSDVLTKTLSQFTGDLTDAELKAQGFNAAQIKAIQQTAKTAMHAATEVKTLQGVLDTAKETAGSGWAQTWQIIFGDFEEAKTLFTGISNAINGFIKSSADARNKILGDWKALGGRTLLIDSIRLAFHNLGMIIKPIKEAFRDIFPAATGKTLMNLTVQFAHFAEMLKPSKETIDNLKRTFRGLFAVLDILKEISFGLWGMWGRLFSALSNGNGDVLNFTGNLGDALVAFHDWLIEGGRLAKFFETLGDILAAPLRIISRLAGAIANLFEGFSSGGISGPMNDMTKAMTPFQRVLEAVTEAWERFIDSLGEAGQIIQPIFDAYISLFHGLGTAIGEAATNMNFDAILEVIKVGFLGGLVLLFKNFFGKGAGIDQLMQGFSGLGGGIIKNISGTLGAVQGRMVAMQQNVKADTLKKIAIAIALLAASIFVLSLVDPERLKSSMVAIGVAMGQLLAAMAIMEKIGTGKGFLRMPFIAASMFLLAGAVDALALAVLALSRLSWDELARGLGGVAALLAIISAALIPLQANSAGMIRTGIGLGVIAVSLNLLALAVRQFASMNMSELGKGLGAVAVSLGLMVKTMSAMAKMKGLQVSAATMIVMALALNLLALAVRQFASMNLKQLAKGLGGVAASLGIMAAALFAMSKIKGLQVTAVQLLAVALALNLIAKAITTMSGMSPEQLAKGLIAIAIALGLLAGAMFLFSKIGMGGAAALGIAAGSLALLIPAIVLLGKQSWTTIIKGLVGLGIALAAIAAAGALMTPAIPGLLGLGAALFLIGGGIALTGAGIFLLSAGLSALIVSLPTGVGVLVAALVELQEGIIKNVKLFALGLLEIVRAFAATAPKFVTALVQILNSVIDGIIQIMPKLKQLTIALIDVLLQILDEKQDDIIQAGLGLLVALLEGIRNNIGKLVTLVGDIVVKFILALANNSRKIIAAGVTFLLTLLKGISSQISRIAKVVTDIIVRFITELSTNWDRVRKAGTNLLLKFINGITQTFVDLIKAGKNAIIKFIEGIGQAAEDIARAARKTAGHFIKTLAEEIVNLVDDAADAVITLINGLADVIENRDDELRAAGQHLGWAIINGMTFGLAGKARDLYNKADEIAHKLAEKMKKPWKIFNPSRVTMDIGIAIGEGLERGIDAKASDVYSSGEAMSTGTIKAFNDTFQTASPSKVMYAIGKFVGQGFANGLRGSADDVRQAFAEMNQKMKDGLAQLRTDLAEEQNRNKELLDKKDEELAKIRERKFKDAGDRAKAIAAVQKEYKKALDESDAAIKNNQTSIKKLISVQKVLNKDMAANRALLIKHKNDLDKYNEQLKEALANMQRVLEERKAWKDEQAKDLSAPPEVSQPMVDEIKAARQKIAGEQKKLNDLLGAGTQDLEAIAEARTSLAEAEGEFKDLTKDKILTASGDQVDVVATYLQDLKNQKAAVATFAETLKQLRTMGIDEKTYRMLVEDGVASQGFAEALLAGGKDAVKQIENLDEDIKTTSETLATVSAEYTFKTGVAIAQGVIDGIESKRQPLLKTIRNLVKSMLGTMNFALKVKSPSEEFAKIGKFAMLGLAKGFEDNTKVVTDAVDQAAQDAVDAMRKTMTDLSGAVGSEINTNPVITPILDLTQVRAGAGELNALSTTTSSELGAVISSEQLRAAQLADDVATVGGTHVKFEQNNYSPEALTEIEIYRQTRNQLSQLKSVLAT